MGSIALQLPQGTLPLKDVLVCPDITRSLLSVSKLTSDYPCEITFDDAFVFIKDKGTKQVLTQGRRHKDLYVLKDVQFQAFYSNRQQVTSVGIWHQRLGHPHMDILQQLASNKAIVFNKINASSVCDACRVGKSSQLPFSSSDCVSKKPLERIHYDLWRPSPVVSAQGFKFYVIFIDNFSRYTWFYPLKLKSDFYSVFFRFQSLVENQFQTKIKQFQCNGGGEFISRQFWIILQSQGFSSLFHVLTPPNRTALPNVNIDI